MVLSKITGLAFVGIAFFAVGCQSVQPPAVEEGNCCLSQAPCVEHELASGNSEVALGNKVNTVTRSIPTLAMKDGEIVQVKPAPMTEDMIENQQLFAMAGDSGEHYNDIKLPGMAHKNSMSSDAANPFVVREFDKNLWPGGVKLEAEIDPDVMDF